MGKVTKMAVPACLICGQAVTAAYAVDSATIGRPLHSLWGVSGSRWMHCSDGAHHHIESIDSDGERIHTYVYLIGRADRNAPFVMARPGSYLDKKARANGGIIRIKL